MEVMIVVPMEVIRRALVPEEVHSTMTVNDSIA
jgi:hypothetical protein